MADQLLVRNACDAVMCAGERFSSVDSYDLTPGPFPNRVLKNPGKSQNGYWQPFNTLRKAGFLPNLLSRLGRDKSEGAGVETAFSTAC